MTEQDIPKLAAAIATILTSGMVLTFNGDLGAGKTTLIRHILKQLGVQGKVKSPTYTLVEPYHVDDRLFYHFDLYRLSDPEELDYIGWQDYFDGHAIAFIEWPQKAQGYLLKPDLELQLSVVNQAREVSFVADNALIRQLSAALEPLFNA